MSLARRVRAGIALHAGVNVAFAAVAVLTAAGGSVVAEASSGDDGRGGETASELAIGGAGGLPVHPVAPAHPLLGDGTADAATAVTAAPTDAQTTTDTTAVSHRGTARSAVAPAASDDDASDDRDDASDDDASDDDAVGTTRRVVSTGYCLRGTTASGVEVGHGMAAMNGVPLGTEWRVHDGPQAGRTFEVTDRIGHSTEFDIWFADCDDALVYGRRTITVEQVG